MNDPIMPKLEPYLIPEGAKKCVRKKKAKGPAVVFGNAKSEVPPKAEVPETPKDQTSEPADEPKKYTLEEAFNYFYDIPSDEEGVFNIERVTRAVAFLLHWCTEMGNHDCEGRAAAGLGHILEQVASQVADHPEPEIRYVYGGPAPKVEPE